VRPQAEEIACLQQTDINRAQTIALPAIFLSGKHRVSEPEKKKNPFLRRFKTQIVIIFWPLRARRKQ